MAPLQAELFWARLPLRLLRLGTAVVDALAVLLHWAVLLLWRRVPPVGAGLLRQSFLWRSLAVVVVTPRHPSVLLDRPQLAVRVGRYPVSQPLLHLLLPRVRYGALGEGVKMDLVGAVWRPHRVLTEQQCAPRTVVYESGFWSTKPPPPLRKAQL